MKDFDEQFKKRWEKKKEAGMLKYILTSGGVFGLAAAVAFVLMKLYAEAPEEVFTTAEAIEKMSFYLFLGIVLGWVMWQLNNRKYEKLK